MTSPSRRSPRLRLAPPPSVDPPYDDERQPAAPTMDGSLALAFPDPPARVPLRLAPPAIEDEDTLDRTARAALPDPRPLTRRLAQALVEVLAGDRPAAQLTRYATLDVLDSLERSVGRLPRAAGRAQIARPVVASVHVSEPADGVVEACAVVATGPRRRAVALRLEGLAGRWQCTQLQIG